LLLAGGLGAVLLVAVVAFAMLSGGEPKAAPVTPSASEINSKASAPAPDPAPDDEPRPERTWANSQPPTTEPAAGEPEPAAGEPEPATGESTGDSTAAATGEPDAPISTEIAEPVPA